MFVLRGPSLVVGFCSRKCGYHEYFLVEGLYNSQMLLACVPSMSMVVYYFSIWLNIMFEFFCWIHLCCQGFMPDPEIIGPHIRLKNAILAWNVPTTAAYD